MSRRPVTYEPVDRPPQCPSRNTSACGRAVVYLQPEVLAFAVDECGATVAPPAGEGRS